MQFRTGAFKDFLGTFVGKPRSCPGFRVNNRFWGLAGMKSAHILQWYTKTEVIFFVTYTVCTLLFTQTLTYAN